VLVAHRAGEFELDGDFHTSFYRRIRANN